MNILLFGAKGQLGQAAQAGLTESRILPFDLPEADITNLDMIRKMLEGHQPDLVINTAAFTDVDGAETDSETAFRVNALGPRNLALETRKYGIPLLHISTDYVFDGERDQAYHEFDHTHPLSVYGASKLAGEEAVRTFNPRHYIVRTAWLYHHVGRNFPLTICALASRPEVRVVHDQFGSPTYAPHLVSALGILIKTQAYGTYHMAGKGRASWYDLARELFQKSGMTTSIIPISRTEFERPARRPKSTVLTTIQDPAILLPPWQDGVKAFVGTIRNPSCI